jgi:hypothetical protein
MFNIKVSSITAGLAFMLSLLIGIISSGNFPISLLRAVLCGAVFFALTAGIYILINMFLPELFQLGQQGQQEQHEEAQEENPVGSHIDISVEDTKAENKPKILQSDPGEHIFKNNKDSPPEETSGMEKDLEKEYSKKERSIEVSAKAAPEPAPVSEAVKPAEKVSSAASSPKPAAVEPWEEIGPAPENTAVQVSGTEKARSPSMAGTSMAQNTGKKLDPKKLDPQQMASTIQSMLRQE